MPRRDWARGGHPNGGKLESFTKQAARERTRLRSPVRQWEWRRLSIGSAHHWPRSHSRAALQRTTVAPGSTVANAAVSADWHASGNVRSRQQLWTRQPAASRQHLRPRCSSRSRPARGSTPQQAGSASPCWCLLVPESQHDNCQHCDLRCQQTDAVLKGVPLLSLQQYLLQRTRSTTRPARGSTPRQELSAVSQLWAIAADPIGCAVSGCHGVCSKCVPSRRPLRFILDRVAVFTMTTRDCDPALLPHTTSTVSHTDMECSSQS